MVNVTAECVGSIETNLWLWRLCIHFIYLTLFSCTTEMFEDELKLWAWLHGQQGGLNEGGDMPLSTQICCCASLLEFSLCMASIVQGWLQSCVVH